MGNSCQTQHRRLSCVRDSIKVMIEHDLASLRKEGQPTEYKPRQSHPMMSKTEVGKMQGEYDKYQQYLSEHCTKQSNN